MKKIASIRSVLMGSAIALAASSASAGSFNIPSGTLAAALDAYSTQSGVQIAISSDNLHGIRTNGVSGDMSSEVALSRLLSGTGFAARKVGNSIAVVRTGGEHSENVSDSINSIQMAQAAAPSRTAVETVTVTSSKLGGADVQSIPISITALSQEQLTATQTAGGPDLVKQVPNLTFTKTNFTGYSIQIRGIGTQAISVTTDPAVAVALNDIPFIRNHFFEQEFFDLSQAEVLRGPQGTLYGRNATAGVVNLTTAKPTDQFEAMASGEIGNYRQRRFEGMINLPIVDDQLDIRLAGEWTKRQGYSYNALTNQRIDGRDLWSSRLSVGWKPLENLQINLVWEHFAEDDDRMRTAKQLCKTAPIPGSVNGIPTNQSGDVPGDTFALGDYLSQGCLPASLYSADAFEVPNGFSLPYYSGATRISAGSIRNAFNVYASTVQSTNLRVIETSLDPVYKAKNDIIELSSDYEVAPGLTLSSETGFNQDFLWSTEDYNRFNSAPGVFVYSATPLGAEAAAVVPDPAAGTGGIPSDSGLFCDPQLGCSNRLVAQDLSEEHAWQLSQEFRLASKFSGPLNFSLGGNYLHYETGEDYYVFINTLTLISLYDSTPPYVGGVTDNSSCLPGGFRQPSPSVQRNPLVYCPYIDPNSISNLNGQGHNYFRSQNPYALNSYAAFGEVYYDVTKDLKVTGGLRWTEDQKHFTDIPSELLIPGYSYAVTGVVNQQWDQFSGRAALNWSPKLAFTDQSMFYGSYSHGYKAGGANPPGAIFSNPGTFVVGSQYLTTDPIHPLTFKPEFVDAFEIGTKNTLLDGTLSFNAAAFYYNYENYQISEILDRTAINLNFDAHVKGAEIESTWEPIPGLRFNFGGGWEDTALAKGTSSVDLMDRTAGTADWIVVKPFVTQASNCVFPNYVVAALLLKGAGIGSTLVNACGAAYSGHLDPVTQLPYTQNPSVTVSGDAVVPPFYPADYPGFDPTTAPNNGAGFSKDLSGNELPNAPPLTVSAGAQYTIPLSSDWASTLRADYYWQDYSWARVFNDSPYDRLRGYTNLNLTVILTSQSGWQVMLYDKNVFNETAITGDFLNSDDSGLTTNVFLTDPKLIGIRVTKNW